MLLRPSRIFAFCLLCLAAAPAAWAKEGDPIRFGVIPRFNPHLTYEYYQPLMDYLGRTTPYRFELRPGRTYLETIEDLRTGVTDIAYLGGATFALANHRFGARALVKPRNAEGGTTYRCFIIVRKDSPVRTIRDLKGKRMAFGARRSTTGSLIPSYMLFEAGVTPDRLQQLANLHNHEEVAKAVLKGIYDAGAVKDVAAWKYQAQGLRIVAESEDLPNAPITAGPTLPKEAETAIVKALLSLDPGRPGGKAVMAQWGPELRHGFVPARNEDYDFLYRKIASIPTGCGIRCHRTNPFLEK
ncbi:MAG: phosphate/phosphite/phosphonate ABC transporter substrate-binding protein [Thermodesulfobacteriota bacterium]